MCGRPIPARWVNSRSPQTLQPALGWLVAISDRSPLQRSKESSERRIRSGCRVRNFSVSVTWKDAARLTAVARIPEVSQVSTGPLGGLGKMQARQAVGGSDGAGKMFMVAA